MSTSSVSLDTEEPAKGPQFVAARAKHWRFLMYFAVSAIHWASLLVVWMTGGWDYDPQRSPDLLNFAIHVWGYLSIPAVYGLLAFVPLRRGARAGRGYFIGAAVLGVIFTGFAFWSDLTFIGIDCRPSSCVPAVPNEGFITAAYLASLFPIVIAPLLLAFVRWPKPE